MNPNFPQFPNPQYYFSPNAVTAEAGIYTTQPPSFAPLNLIQPFHFSKRIAKLDFQSIGNVDVTKIAKTGDILSVQQLLYPIAFANITQEDAPKFGTRGALHSFLILQMAVEYLIGVVNSLLSKTPPQNVKPKDPCSQPNDPLKTMNYEAQIQMLKKDIQSRDLIIENISDKLSDCQAERDALREKLNVMKERKKQERLNPIIENEPSEGEYRFNYNPRHSSTPQPKRTQKRRNKNDQRPKNQRDETTNNSKRKPYNLLESSSFYEETSSSSYYSSSDATSSGWI